MKKMKRIVSLVLIVSTILALSGCTTYNNFKYAFFGGEKTNKEPTIKIGVYEPMTGKFSKQGKEEIIGIELAHEMLPKALGKEIELIYVDNKSEMDDAKSALDTLYAQKPSIVLGSYGEVLTIMAGDYAKINSTPSIAITSVNPLITKNSDYCFTTNISEEKQGEALADYLVNGLSMSKFATVKMYNDDAAQAVIKRFTTKAKKLTGDKNCIVANINLENLGPDYESAVNYIRESGAEGILIATPQGICMDFLNKCKEMEFIYPTFVGTKTFDNADFAKYLTENKEFSFAFPSDSTVVDTDRYAVFQRLYHEKYGNDSEPTAAMALGFDAYTLAYTALQKTGEWINNGETDSLIPLDASDAQVKAFRQELEASKKSGIPSGYFLRLGIKSIIKFSGASGYITYNNSNEASKTITIDRFTLGSEQEQYVVEY